MLTTERKAALLDRLAQKGKLVAASLAVEWGVSEDTIRRDLRDLAAAGRLVRVHGGALPASPTHLPLAKRSLLQREAKARLGRAAAGLIRPDMIVLMDGGTTHLALVAALPQSLRATIVTHSPGIAAALEQHDCVDVILIGGRLFRHSMVAMGPSTQDALSRLRADLCFLGVTGVHPDLGLTTGDAEEAALKGALIASAAETVVLATPEKISAASPWIIAPLERIDHLVTVGTRPDWLHSGLVHTSA